MKAVYLEEKAGADSLIVGDIPKPVAAEDEVVIRVHATAVMPTELDWFPTFSFKSGQSRPFPIVLSHEFSGVVDAVGTKASGVKIGELVYGLNDWFINGAQAEYCVTVPSMLAPKPKSLDSIQAATVPISALTAWQGLFDRLYLRQGQRILIHGATGGVGALATQLAHSHGAHVIGTTSAANLAFARELGADEVIDYRATRFEDAVRQVDAVFDCVGGDTLNRSWSVLGKGGKLVTIASEYEKTNERNREAFMLVQADGAQLRQIGDLIDAGKLRIFVEEVFPLAKSREAYARAQKGGMRGKVALRVVDA